MLNINIQWVIDMLRRSVFVTLNLASRKECVYVYLSISFLISGATLADTNGVSIDLKDEQFVYGWQRLALLCLIYAWYTVHTFVNEEIKGASYLLKVMTTAFLKY